MHKSTVHKRKVKKLRLDKKKKKKLLKRKRASGKRGPSLSPQPTYQHRGRDGRDGNIGPTALQEGASGQHCDGFRLRFYSSSFFSFFWRRFFLRFLIYIRSWTMLFVVDILKVSAFKSIPTNQNKNSLRMIFNYSKQNVIQLSKPWFSR